VVARHLHNAGADVEVHLAFDATALSRDSAAAVNLDVIRKTSLRLFETRPPFPTPQCLRRGKALTVVDALLGTGLSRPLDDPFLTWVRAINGGGFPVLALDVPTGLDANSGEVLGDCVAARHTFSFAAAKLGFYRGSGPKLCGQVHVVDIGMPREIWQTTGVPSRGW
jgi:NAD(P)H-hydrate epimerase